MGASLDHCMWFHRDVRADEWLLYDTDSPIAHGGRGLARGFLFNQAGPAAWSRWSKKDSRASSTHEARSRRP